MSALTPLRARVVRIHYRHWGKHSGFCQLLRYFDPERVRLETQAVPLQSEEPRFLDRFSKRLSESVVGDRRTTWYTSIDLAADWITFARTVLARIDIVHYLDGEHSLGVLPHLLRTSRLLKHRPRVVATFHQPSAWLADIASADLLRSVDQITVVSSEQKTFLQNLVPDRPVTFIPHGIDLDFFHPVSDPVKSAGFRCLTVGNWLRNVDLLAALATRMRRYRDIEFHVISTGGFRSDLENVHIHSGLTDESLRDHYHKADILLLPLVNCTANNALLEGIACGLPVVTSDLSGVRDYTPGIEAVRIAGTDPADFEKAILRLRENPEKLQVMARHARARAEMYDWRKITREYDALYHRAISADQ